MTRTQQLLAELRLQDRRCHGGTSEELCGKRATVVTSSDRLQWYACDDPEHQGSETMTIDEWWQHIADTLGERRR
jgi:hypothetical protein